MALDAVILTGYSFYNLEMVLQPLPNFVDGGWPIRTVWNGLYTAVCLL